MSVLLSAFLGALGTGASGIAGAIASNRAAGYNYQVDLLNYYQRERERSEALAAAKKRESETKLGTTDAAGNRTYFKPGVGWVTELADDQRTLQELYQQEELQQLQNDLPKQRQILNANVARQGRENNQADALFDAFQRVQRGDAREVENQMNQASSRGITQGFDSALQDAMRAAVRTGASNSGKVAADIGSERAKALETAFMNNKLNAKQQVDANYETERGNLANLYNMFATRASSMPGIGYNPRNIEGMTAGQQEGAIGNNSNAASALINAFAKQGGSMSRIEPNYGIANAIQQVTGAVTGGMDMVRNDRQRNQMMDAFAQYGGLDPSMFKQSAGAW